MKDKLLNWLHFLSYYCTLRSTYRFIARYNRVSLLEFIRNDPRKHNALLRKPCDISFTQRTTCQLLLQNLKIDTLWCPCTFFSNCTHSLIFGILVHTFMITQYMIEVYGRTQHCNSLQIIEQQNITPSTVQSGNAEAAQKKMQSMLSTTAQQSQCADSC